MEFPDTYPTTRTINGRPVILFTDEGKGDYPILGAYWNRICWIPAAWTSEGYKFQDVPYHGLNIILDKAPEVA